jgi:hypothetical protein
MLKSGKVVIAAEAALEYGFTDVNGKQPRSLREQKALPAHSSRKTDFISIRGEVFMNMQPTKVSSQPENGLPICKSIRKTGATQ